MGLTPEEIEERRWHVRQIRHSTELEGGRSNDAARAIQDRWVRGEIDDDEWVWLTQELHRETVAREDA